MHKRQSDRACCQCCPCFGQIQAELGEGHVNIVEANEIILTDRHLCLVMEYAAGNSLTGEACDFCSIRLVAISSGSTNLCCIFYLALKLLTLLLLLPLLLALLPLDVAVAGTPAAAATSSACAALAIAATAAAAAGAAAAAASGIAAVAAAAAIMLPLLLLLLLL